MPHRRPRRDRLSRSLLASLALHAAAAAIAFKSCVDEQPPVSLTRTRELVTVEVAAFPRTPQPKTARPGGGVQAPLLAHRPPQLRAMTAAPKVIAAAPEEPHGREAAVAARVDVVAAPSPAPRPVVVATAGPFGTGPGAHGGPGGPGAGQGGGPPLVSGDFAFGSSTPARFRGVACFFSPGILRIADVRECTPAAVFYTNTFDIPERQQAEGFPGITARATWFMIEYTGVFTVSHDGTYEFRLHSDDGSYLFIDGAKVINNDGKHKPESRVGSIRLASGEHQLKILYAQTTDRMALQLFVRVPGGGDEKLFTPRI
jgi:hypothetical protein